MKHCPRCLNLSNDNAIACEHCGTVLDDSVIARAEGGRGIRTPTIAEGDSRPRPTPPPAQFRPAAPSAEFRPTPPPLPGTQSGRRGETLYMPPAAATVDNAPSAARVAPQRRIVAILVTYSWKPEGQVFPVREGRNLIGRGEECDIRIPDDPMLSQVNSHITFRKNFVVGDMVSMGGTDLNGEAIEQQFVPMDNYAKIRTGSTHWSFVIIDPALISAENV